MNKLKIDKYMSEIENFYDILDDKAINLVVSGTGSGKTFSMITNMSKTYNVGVLAPFISLANQIALDNEGNDLTRRTGLTAQDTITHSNGMITSFHSAPRLLEMHNIDLLVIDEIHYLLDYAGFSGQIIEPLWNTVAMLQAKFPHMKVVALTATPHFIQMADFLNFNTIVVEQKYPTAKPDSIHVGRGWTEHFKKDQSIFAIAPSVKVGSGWAAKYKGTFISAAHKETAAYESVIQGKMPSKKLFATTVLSTGISITDPVDVVYTNWLDLSTIVQSSARPRQGGHKLFVTQTPNPWFLKNGCSEPALIFGKDFKKNFQLIAKYAEWYSWVCHQEESDLYAIIYQMMHAPEIKLPQL